MRVGLPGKANESSLPSNDPEGVSPSVLGLPASVARERENSDDFLGVPARPFDRRLLRLIGALVAIPVAETIHCCSTRLPSPVRVSASARRAECFSATRPTMFSQRYRRSRV